MKIEKKQCTRCSQLLSLRYFRINKRTVQLTKYCVKCLEKSIQQTRCQHNKKRSTFINCGGDHIFKHNKIRSGCARIVAEVKFVSTASKDQYAKIVIEVKLVSTRRQNHNGKIAIPLDTFLGSCEAVFILP